MRCKGNNSFCCAGKNYDGRENNTRFNGKEAALHGRHDLRFELCRNVSDPWNVFHGM